MVVSYFWSYRELEQCESTQLLAIESIRKGDFKGPFALSCLQQTAGFGRRGDPWIDCGQSVALSLAWKPRSEDVVADERWPSWISLWVWRALVDFDDNLKPVLRLKWPNDLVIGPNKLGGVLVSQFVAQGETFRVAGLGINLSWNVVKPQSVGVTDLQSHMGVAVDRQQIISRILRAVAHGLETREDARELDAQLEALRLG